MSTENTGSSTSMHYAQAYQW